MIAISDQYANDGDFDLIQDMYKATNVEIPKAIHDILEAPVRHRKVCTKAGMVDEVKNFLKI